MENPSITLNRLRDRDYDQTIEVNRDGTATLKMGGRYYTVVVKNKEGKKVEFNQIDQWEEITDYALDILERKRILTPGHKPKPLGDSVINSKGLHIHGKDYRHENERARREDSAQAYYELDAYIRSHSKPSKTRGRSKKKDHHHSTKRHRRHERSLSPNIITPPRVHTPPINSDPLTADLVMQQKRLTDIVQYNIEATQQQIQDLMKLNRDLLVGLDNSERDKVMMARENVRQYEALTNKILEEMGDNLKDKTGSQNAQMNRIIGVMTEAFERCVPQPTDNRLDIRALLERDAKFMEQLATILKDAHPAPGAAGNGQIVDQALQHVQYDAILRDLRQEFQNLREVLTNRDNQEQVVNSILERMRALEDAIGKLQNQNEGQAAIVQLQSELSQANSKLGIANTKVENAERRLSDFRDQQADVNNNNDGAIRDLRDQLRLKNVDNKRLQQLVEELRGQNSDLIRQLNDGIGNDEQFRNQIQMLRGELNEVQDSRRENEELRRQLEELRLENEELRRRLLQQQERNEKLNKLLNELRSQLENETNGNESLRKDINLLQQKLNEVHATDVENTELKRQLDEATKGEAQALYKNVLNNILRRINTPGAAAMYLGSQRVTNETVRELGSMLGMGVQIANIIKNKTYLKAD